jgi:hypothetical protein
LSGTTEFFEKSRESLKRTKKRAHLIDRNTDGWMGWIEV